MAKKRGEFEDVRTTILSTAAELIAQSGAHAASLADIAEKAKLSKGTLYYYYQSKEHLLADVTDYYLGQVTDTMLSWVESLDRETPALDSLVQLVSMITDNDQLMKLHIALCAEASRDNSPLKAKFAAKYREWTVILEVGSLRMPMFDLDRESRLSRIFFIMLDGFLLKKAMGVETVSSESLFSILIDSQQ